MPVIQKETSVGAAATVSIFSGSAFEFARQRMVASIGITAAATGTFFTLTSGADVIVEESAPSVATVFPVIPDQMYYNDLLEPGDRLVLSVRNPTAGAIVHRAIAQLSAI